MLKINWAKIDKFYPILICVMVAVAALFVFTFRTILATFVTAYEVDQGEIEGELRINKTRLDEAYNFVFEKPKATPSAIIKENK